jgi:hypothetical protein
MYTGANFLEDIRQISTEYQSEFLNPALAQNIADMALNTIVEDCYRKYPQQRAVDRIYGLIKSSVSYIPNSNILNLYGNTVPISNIVIAGGSPLTYRITFSSPHGFTIGDLIVIQNVPSPPNANGTYLGVSSITTIPYQFQVFSATEIDVIVSGSGATYAPGGFARFANFVPDYYHLLAAEARFRGDAYTITGANNATTATVTLNSQTNLRAGEMVYIEGVLGMTSINGNFYVKPLPANKYALYADKNLTIPVIPNAAYTSGGTLSRVYSKFTKTQVADERISIYKPTLNNPRTIQNRTQLLFLPTEYECYEALLDYICKPQRFIVTDNTIDLEAFYNRDFIENMKQLAVMAFNTSSEDPEQYQLLQAQLAANNQ